MNEVDWVILAVLFLSTILGVSRGVVREILAIVGWVVGIFLALRYAPDVAERIPLPSVSILIRTAFAAVAIAVVVAALCGALSGFFVAYCGVQPMVVTLGGSFLYSGIALMVSGMSATPAYQGSGGFPAKNEAGKFVSFRFLGKGNIFGIPTQIVIYVVLILLCMWILHRTKYGERLFLIGVNPQAAEYSGINTRATIMSTYVLSAVSAAIAGTLLTANVNSAKYDLGSGYTLAIITAVVLGGTLNTGGKGSIIGTVLASLIICILRYGLPLCFGVSTQNLDLPIGLILVVVVLGREIAGQHMLSHLFKRKKG